MQQSTCSGVGVRTPGFYSSSTKALLCELRLPPMYTDLSLRLNHPQGSSGPFWLSILALHPPASVSPPVGLGTGLDVAVWGNEVSNEHPRFSVDSYPTSWNVSGMAGQEAGPCTMGAFQAWKSPFTSNTSSLPWDGRQFSGVSEFKFTSSLGWRIILCWASDPESQVYRFWELDWSV